MLIAFRKILILVAICSLPANNVLAQKGKRKVSSKKQESEKLLPIPKAPIEETYIDKSGLKEEVPPGEAKPIPKGESEFEKTQQSIPDSKSPEEIIKYFIDYASTSKYFTFTYGGTQLGKHMHIDSLLPIYMTLIDSIAIKNKEEFEGYGDYIETGIIKKVHDKIALEYAKPIKDRQKEILSEILDSINQMPASKEKVDLVLQYAILELNSESYYENLSNAYYHSEDIVSLIASPYQQAKAYSYIGDFAKDYKDEWTAAQMYFKALFYLEYSTISEQLKDTKRGLIYQKVSDLFYFQNDINSLQKNLQYLYDADNYFRKAKSWDNVNTNWAYIFSNEAYLSSFYNRGDTSFYFNSLDSSTLSQLYSWFSYYREFTYSAEINYLGFYGVATILKQQGKLKEALYFYQRALTHALFTHKIRTIGQAIWSITNISQLLGDREKVKDYEKLRFYLAKKCESYWEYDKATLTVADNFFAVKQYDSALIYINKFQFDTLAKSYYYPPDYAELYSWAINTKLTILESLKSDSVKHYSNEMYSQKEEIQNRYSSLLEAESYGARSLSELQKKLQGDTLNFKIDALEREKTNLYKEMNNLADEVFITKSTVNKLNSEARSLIRNNKKLKDSVISRNLTLAGIVSKNVSLALDNERLLKDRHGLAQNITDQKTEIDKQKVEIAILLSQKKQIKGWTIGIVVLLAVGFYALLFLVRDLKKKRQETKGLKTIIEANEDAHISDLQYQNEKILKEYTLKHEIVGILQNLGASFESFGRDIRDDDLVLKNGFSILKGKLTKLSSFANTYYMSLQNEEYNSIDAEVRLASEYVDFVKIKTNGADIFFVDNRRHKNIGYALPHHSVNSLVKNSIEKGKKPNEPIQITIDDRFEGNTYILEVFDDGVGVGENFDSENIYISGTGIKNLRKQVEFFNTQKNNNCTIELDRGFIRDKKKIDGKHGTVVTLKIKPKHESN